MDRIRRLMDLPVEPSTAMRNERPTTLAEVVSLMPFLSHFFVLRAVDIYIFTERQKDKKDADNELFLFLVRVEKTLNEGGSCHAGRDRKQQRASN